MDYDAIRAALQGAVPFNAHVGLEIAEVGPGHGVVRLPDRDELRNHVGSQHAGALFAAGEAASGAAFVGAFGERLAAIRPLVEDAKIVYRRPASGAVIATGRLTHDRDALLAELDGVGRVSFDVGVELTDGAGDVVAEMTVTWVVKSAS